MSQPYNPGPNEAVDPFSRIPSEIVSGCSALHMDPDPIPPEEVPPGHTYLADTDRMVQHSLGHFHAALELHNQASRRITRMCLDVAKMASRLENHEDPNVRHLAQAIYKQVMEPTW